MPKLPFHEDNRILLVACIGGYKEDTSVCDSDGEPKGQCVNCGAKWYEHPLGTLFGDDYKSAKALQDYRGTK